MRGGQGSGRGGVRCLATWTKSIHTNVLGDAVSTYFDWVIRAGVHPKFPIRRDWLQNLLERGIRAAQIQSFFYIRANSCLCLCAIPLGLVM